MNVLPNPFLNPDATTSLASEAAASSAPQSGAAAIHSNPDLSIPSEPAPQPAEAHPAPASAGLLDPAVITAKDEALYWQLRRAVDPLQRGLSEIPDADAFFEAIEPAPLFLQRAG